MAEGEVDLFKTATAGPAQGKSAERVLTKQAVTIGEFINFTVGLPDHGVILRYPGDTERCLPLQRIRDSLVAANADQFIYGEELSYVLTTMRSKDGWLCLEYSISLDALVKDIVSRESAIRMQDPAREIVSLLRRADAYVEIGISQAQLSERLGEAWLHYRDFCATYTARFPLFTAVISAAFNHYRRSLNIWREHRDLLPIQFVGGGFGLEGAMQGMAAACLLQAIVDHRNENHASSTRAKLELEWFHASLMTEAAHEALIRG